MKRLTILLLLLGVSGSALGAAQGESVFKKNCVACHGTDGKGNTPQGKRLGAANLTSSDIQSMSETGMAGIVKYGRGVMPPFGKTLTAEEIKQVVQFVRTLTKQQ